METINIFDKRQRKPNGAIKNGQFRETGNNGHTKGRTKTNKAENTTQDTIIIL